MLSIVSVLNMFLTFYMEEEQGMGWGEKGEAPTSNKLRVDEFASGGIMAYFFEIVPVIVVGCSERGR